MLFAAGARSELSSADGRRRPIAFYDALNGDIAAYFDDKTIVAGDLDDLFSELLDQDTCHIHIPVHVEPATGDEGPVLGQTVLDLARIDTPGESQDMYTCQVSISVGSKVLHAVNGTPVRYPAVAIENGLNRISADCERVPRCCVFCRYANYEAIPVPRADDSLVKAIVLRRSDELDSDAGGARSDLRLVSR